MRSLGARQRLHRGPRTSVSSGSVTASSQSQTRHRRVDVEDRAFSFRSFRGHATQKFPTLAGPAERSRFAAALLVVAIADPPALRRLRSYS